MMIKRCILIIFSKKFVNILPCAWIIKTNEVWDSLVVRGYFNACITMDYTTCKNKEVKIDNLSIFIAINKSLVLITFDSDKILPSESKIFITKIIDNILFDLYQNFLGLKTPL